MIIFNYIKRIVKALNVGMAQVLLWVFALNVLFGIAFYFAERDVQEGLTLLDSLWWSMVTMTTVGYGDYYAQTFVGRFLISYPAMFIGIGVIGYMVGVVANELLDWASRKRKGQMTIRFKNHIIICNYPSEERVMDVARELRAIPRFKDRPIVLVNDKLEEIDARLMKKDFHFVRGSTTDESVLKRSGILHCEGVIILSEDPGNERSDDRNYTTGSLVEILGQEAGVEIKTVAELVNRSSLRTFSHTQVDGTVAVEGLTTGLLAQEFNHPGVTGVIDQMVTTTRGSQLYLHQSTLVGTSIVELQKAVLEHETNLQIIGMIRNGESVLNPPKNVKIEKDDRLIILAENAYDLATIEKEIIANKA